MISNRFRVIFVRSTMTARTCKFYKYKNNKYLLTQKIKRRIKKEKKEETHVSLILFILSIIYKLLFLEFDQN